MRPGSHAVGHLLCADVHGSVSLTKGLHWLHQLEGEGLVSGKLFQHAGHLIMPRAHDVLPVYALYVVAHGDHLHAVHHAALFDALPCRGDQRDVWNSNDGKRTSRICETPRERFASVRN